MRPTITGAVVRTVVLIIWLGATRPASSAAASPPKAPSVVVDLATIGWATPPSESNRKFFKDFTLAKLFATDPNTRVGFLSEDVVAVYHTKKEEGKDWRTVPRIMEAFFIRTKDGSLLSTQRWPVSLRKSNNDLYDSEARLIPLYDGRFLVFTNATIALYGPNLELLKQKKLEPSSGLWSAQGVAEGRGIFLRHESTSAQVTYFWLNSDTLEVKYQMPGYQSSDFPARQAVDAGENAVFAVSRTGILMIDHDQRVKTICDDQLCREDGLLQVFTSHYIGWSGRSGIGIIDTERGRLVWSRAAQPQYHHGQFQFGGMRSAMSGTKFALWVEASNKAIFDGVEIRPAPIMLLYDVATPNDRPIVIQVRPVRPDWGFALSPHGRKLALFDGAKVQIYSLD
jgi:hypothetical protein